MPGLPAGSVPGSYAWSSLSSRAALMRPKARCRPSWAVTIVRAGVDGGGAGAAVVGVHIPQAEGGRSPPTGEGSSPSFFSRTMPSSLTVLESAAAAALDSWRWHRAGGNRSCPTRRSPPPR